LEVSIYTKLRLVSQGMKVQSTIAVFPSLPEGSLSPSTAAELDWHKI